MNSKLIGGILLIVGTSIGGGMLALPLTNATSGFITSSILLILCWFLMTFCALLVLEVNLWLPKDSNLISMTQSTLGRLPTLIAWCSYLILFYALLAAYTSSGSDILHKLLQLIGLELPAWSTQSLFIVGFGLIVYGGIQVVDYANRSLMVVKLTAYGLLTGSIIWFIEPSKLFLGQARYGLAAVTVMIASFGFATIVPSLRSYFEDDIKQLRRAIIYGSLIPLGCYLLWDAAILGTLNHQGINSLAAILSSGHPTTELSSSLSLQLHNGWITGCTRLFSSICVATSFLGVALGLSDFIADGFKLSKQGFDKFIIYAVTFLPPLSLTLFYPDAFIKALSIAGALCTLLLVIYPVAMTWAGRYYRNYQGPYQVAGGKIALIIAGFVGLGIINLAIWGPG